MSRLIWTFSTTAGSHRSSVSNSTRGAARISAHRTIELITRLTDNDLCLPQKAIGLLAWGGITHERRYPDLWPAQLITRRSLRGGNESSTFCRWLHHIKIVLEPDAPPTAKAYLAVSHAFLGDSVIREVLQLATLATEKPS